VTTTVQDDAATVVPYGEWASPLSPSRAASGSPRFTGLGLGRNPDGEAVVWFSELLEGRNVVSRQDRRGVHRVRQVASARSRLNEYGGGAFWVGGDVLFWVEDDDQRIRRLDPETSLVALLTPAPPSPRAWRYAGGVVVASESFTGEQWMVCERQVLCDAEGNPLEEPRNDLVAVTAAQAVDGEPRDPVLLVEGSDFLAAPALSPDGTWLAWLRWDHPDMPWDAAELWVGELELGERPSVRDARRVAGGRSDGDADALRRPVSVCLPAWSPDGRLHFCDDREDRWLLRSVELPGLPPEGGAESAPTSWDGGGEVGEPRWIAGGSRYGFLDGGRIVLAETVDGLDRMVVLEPDGSSPPAPVECTYLGELRSEGSVVAAVVGRPSRVTTTVRMDLGAESAGGVAELTEANAPLALGSISVAEPITVPTPDGEVVHALFLPPRLEGVVGPEGDRPPLVVRIHGGPTAHAIAELTTSVQFWTTRGFAVAEVNYRGSAGFGRKYRDRLNGGWGLVEVQDCITVAAHLAAEGLADPRRCVIRGGSAGGFTALEAVCAPDRDGFHFAAATSLYGVTDLAVLATDTHKFESRYLDALVGPLPEAAQRYRDRSPLHHAERIAAPVLLLQGLDDMIVPPAQAEVLVAAMEAGGIDHEYRAYPGEGHGFRRHATILDALEAELAFYGRVLGFDPSMAAPGPTARH
jgi:dipeptidyl aminopeptidase/acylaminoacyl peptidase